jgi:hypothetical protein
MRYKLTLSNSFISSVPTAKVMSLIQDTDPDLSTQSNYGDIPTTSVILDWTVDFDTKTINGSIELNLTVKKDGLSELMFVVFSTFSALFYRWNLTA